MTLRDIPDEQLEDLIRAAFRSPAEEIARLRIENAQLRGAANYRLLWDSAHAAWMNAKNEANRLEAENAQLRAALMGMARRLAAASECLGRAAERGAIDQGSFQG